MRVIQDLLPSSILDSLTKWAASQTGLITLVLFGSRASNTARPDSDYDFAALYAHGSVPSSWEVLQKIEDLRAITNTPTHFVVLNQAGPIIGMEVWQTGVPVIVADPYAWDLWIIRLYSEYTELKELRAPIEKNILKRRLYD